MPAEPNLAVTSGSPISSGRASPSIRAGRKAEEAALKADKTVRRYAAGIEKALYTFEPNQQEWADYIAFLARLLKAIQGVKQADFIPHAAQISLRLAQCLNPTLPSGVHQKALEVYASVFEILGTDNLGRDLQTFLPGLLPILSFASLTVRPLYYSLLENHVLKLGFRSLRPALKSIILSLLPGIEDETSEDFERGIQAMDRLRSKAQSPGMTDTADGDIPDGSYYWQCFFLAVITGATKRQGALAFLLRRLPSLQTPPNAAIRNGTNGSVTPVFSNEAGAIDRPDPGLLLRCFAAGLRDANILVQRGFLDLLVTHIPLHSPVLQSIAHRTDLDLLVGATVSVVLRRDMSLNRRLWSWYLGPEPPSDGTIPADEVPKTPLSDAGDAQSGRQAAYFQSYGAASLNRYILSMFAESARDSIEAARPFRICSALMDRWEIGGCIIPSVFLPAQKAAFASFQTSDEQTAKDVIKSASLFFDGIESNLIWSQIINELSAAVKATSTSSTNTEDSLRFLRFMFTKFNIREEDMLLYHIPRTLLVAVHSLLEILTRTSQAHTSTFVNLLFDLVLQLATFVPEHALQSRSKSSINMQTSSVSDSVADAVRQIEHGALDFDQLTTTPLDGLNVPDISVLLQHCASTLFQMSLSKHELHRYSARSAELLSGLVNKTKSTIGLDATTLEQNMSDSMDQLVRGWQNGRSDFLVATAVITVWSDVVDVLTASDKHVKQSRVSSAALEYMWLALSPATPKYHVEAVRLIWKLHVFSQEGEKPADVDVFVTGCLSRSSNGDQFRRFATLWELTLQNQPSRIERKAGTLTRRASSFASTSEITSHEAQRILSRSLRILLDNLASSESDYSSSIAAWLSSLPSLDKIITNILAQLESGLESFERQKQLHGNKLRSHRGSLESIAEMQVGINHLTAILLRASNHTWGSLMEARLHEDDTQKSELSGLQYLATFSVRLLENVDSVEHETFHRRVVRLLTLLYDSPFATVLRPLILEERLIAVLRRIVAGQSIALQIEYVRLLAGALRVRVTADRSADRRPSIKLQDQPGHLQDAAGQLTIEAVNYPPAHLFDCIREAIASLSTRPYLEHWIMFLNDVLAMFSQAMFSEMIPLVELFCEHINLTFGHLKSMATASAASDQQFQISSLPWLLNGLESVLASGHSNLTLAAPDQPSAKQVASPQSSFFGATTMSILSPLANPNKTAKSNSRLTVILCLHDTVQVCFNMWSWSSYGSDTASIDPASAATTNLNALRLRNRTKKILEHLFTAEALECLEMLILTWVKAKTHAKPEVPAESVLGVLNVLAPSRPRNTMPLILNALYSRTNIDALEASRRSSLTCNLGALDVVGFLLQYVTAIEDDAMDEIWTDCMTFLRDVLANPMPHRQVLPALLELIALLAEKIHNTNFGELQKMHRELADIFSRLLTASFTVRPAGGAVEVKTKSPIHSGDLFASLIEVTPKFQIVLESKERVLSTVNNLTTYVISPIFHAKLYPDNVRPELLQLILLMSTQAPDAKLWRREVADAFADARTFTIPATVMEAHYFPVLRKWVLADKDVVTTDILPRIPAPSSSSVLMFGVGASSARTTADRAAQLNLRRIALLLLAQQDRSTESSGAVATATALMSAVPAIDAKLAELSAATPTSSPSAATRAEVCMLYRALFLCVPETQLAGVWPTLNAMLQSVLLSLLPPSSAADDATTAAVAEAESFGNLALLQAAKLLDLLAVLQPDEFQLHEWVFLTNTVDAVYGAGGVAAAASGGGPPLAIADEVTDALASSVSAASLDDGEKRAGEAAADAAGRGGVGGHAGDAQGSFAGYNYEASDTEQPDDDGRRRRGVKGGGRRPVLALLQLDAGDVRAMAREDFVRQLMLPFLSGLSISAYEGAYGMAGVDLGVCRRDLLNDLMEGATVV